MSILILNRRPLSMMPYHEWLADSKEPIVLFTARDSIDLSPSQIEELRGHYASLELFDDFGRNGEVEWEAIKRHEERPFSHVVAPSEHDLIRAASLRRRFGIAGQDLESAFAFRDKVIMKDRLTRAGIPVTSYRPLFNVTELIDFLEEHGAPVVVKPRNGAGSVGVKVIRSERDLEDFLTTGLASTVDTASTLMAEKFIEGRMYHVDGLVQDGIVHFIWPSLYVTDGLAFTEGKIHAGHTLDARNPLRRRLQDFVRQVLAVLPTPSLSAFHAEVFETTDGKLLLGEIASRIGGPLVSEILELAFGFKFWRSTMRGAAGLDLDLPAQLKGGDFSPQPLGAWLIIPPRPGILRRAPAQAPYPWVAEYRLLVEPNQSLKAPDSSMTHIASFVIESGNEEEARERIEAVTEWFEERAIIAPLTSAAVQESPQLPLSAPALPVSPAVIATGTRRESSRRLCC